MKDKIVFLLFVLICVFFYWKGTSDKNEQQQSQPHSSELQVSPVPIDRQSVQQISNTAVFGEYNGVLRYCLDGGWDEFQKGVIRQGFYSWQSAGVSFVESAEPNCDTRIYVDSTDSAPGTGSLWPEYISINPDHLSVLVAAHEIGHNLGVSHESHGLMEPYINDKDTTTAVPSEHSIAVVKELWGTQ